MKLSDVDLLADTWAREVPYEMFDLLRREAPVFRHPEPYGGPGFWALTRYDDVVEVSRDTDTFSSWLGSTFIVTQDEESLANMRLSILNMDPPQHNRYRRLVSKGFTPRTIARLEAEIEQRAERIVREVAEKGECEFVNEVAAKLPLEMICELMGIPDPDRPRIFELSNMLVGWDDPDVQATPEDGERAAVEIFAYCAQIAAERRANPKDDVVSAMVHAEVDGERLTDLEINLFFVTLAVAGNETTRNLIANSALALSERPEVVRELRADPSLWPTAVEEMLRWGTSIQNFRRTATRDTEIRGQPIASGDKVVLFYLAANRDPEAFPDPYRFDVRREPNEHVTFGGGGVHYCLGSHLARAEIGAIMRRVVERVGEFELAGPVRRLRSDFINGIKQLPIRWEPAAA
jgi:cholest-4-en-3-one 26-monooxygenase